MLQLKKFHDIPVSTRDETEEMGLISPGGENLLDFLEFQQVLST